MIQAVQAQRVSKATWLLLICLACILFSLCMVSAKEDTRNTDTPLYTSNTSVYVNVDDIIDPGSGGGFVSTNGTNFIVKNNTHESGVYYSISGVVHRPGSADREQTIRDTAWDNTETCGQVSVRDIVLPNDAIVINELDHLNDMVTVGCDSIDSSHGGLVFVDRVHDPIVVGEPVLWHVSYVYEGIAYGVDYLTAPVYATSTFDVLNYSGSDIVGWEKTIVLTSTYADVYGSFDVVVAVPSIDSIAVVPLLNYSIVNETHISIRVESFSSSLSLRVSSPRETIDAKDSDDGARHSATILPGATSTSSSPSPIPSPQESADIVESAPLFDAVEPIQPGQATVKRGIYTAHGTHQPAVVHFKKKETVHGLHAASLVIAEGTEEGIEKVYMSDDEHTQDVGLDVGIYDITVSPTAHPIKHIEFFDVVVQDTVDLVRIDDVFDRPEFVQTYAIDPSSMNFTYGTVTVTAKGRNVYKCKAWDYENRVCNGSWDLILDNVVPGSTYTLHLTPDDPAFGEGDPDAYPAECAFNDDPGEGDNDQYVDCVDEMNVTNNGVTADLHDFEQAGKNAVMQMNFSNSLNVDAVNDINVTFRYKRTTNALVGNTSATIQLFNGTWNVACNDTVVSVGSWENYTCSLNGLVVTQADVRDIRIGVFVDTAPFNAEDSTGLTHVDYAYVSIDYNKTDLAAPNWSMNITAPGSPATYFPGQENWFNVSWSDDVELDTVLLENNFSGTLENITVSNDNEVYYYVTNLSAGYYQWRFFANDSTGKTNVTDSYTYTYYKAFSNIELLIDGDFANQTRFANQTINVSAIINDPSSDYIQLYRNGTLLANATSHATNLTFYENVTTYNLTAIYIGNENYTDARLTSILTIEPSFQFNLSFENNLSSGQPSEIVIRNSSGDIIETGSGNASESLGQNQLFNVSIVSNISGEEQVIIFSDLNVTGNLNIPMQVQDNYTHSIPYYLNNTTSIFVVNDSGLDYDYATIAIPTDGSEVNDIMHCTNWNFENRTCLNWEINSTDEYNATSNATHIIFNTTSFDAFGGGNGKPSLHLTNITVWDVTALERGDTSNLTHHGVNDTFNLSVDRSYRFEFTIYNNGSNWPIRKQDYMNHTNLSDQWLVNTSDEIWYLDGKANQNRTGGYFVNGAIGWDLSNKGRVKNNQYGVFSYVVNVTGSVEKNHSTFFIVNDTSKKTGFFDYQTLNFINPPDLQVLGITFSDPSPIETEKVNATVNVTNTGGRNSSNFTVELNISWYNGTFHVNESLQSASLNITVGDSVPVDFEWTTQVGTYEFNAHADSLDAVFEKYEANNELAVNLSTSAWEILYGNYSYTIQLTDTGNAHVFKSVEATTGNSFYIDTDGSFDPLNLLPLNGTNDLIEADVALNMTNFSDSVRNLYDTDGNNIPDVTDTFVIGGISVDNVPIINTTNTNAFVTGIMWDSGDGGSEYDGTQDLVFVTRLNESQIGMYGRYDYEVRIPSGLARISGVIDSVDRYDEMG